MKLLITVCLLFAGFMAIKADKNMLVQLKEHLKSCGEKLGVDLLFLAPAENTDLKPDFAKLSQPEYKCAPQCIFEKYELIDAAGNYNENKLKEYIPGVPDPVLTVVKECVGAYSDEDLCDRYSKVNTCLMEKIPKPT